MAQTAPEIFKAYDIRGIVGQTLTEDTARLIGRAIASRAAAQGIGSIAVGRDGRLSGPALAAALCCGLTESGIRVTDVGMVATPMLYFAAVSECGGSGIMITGSHNPPDYNGFKIMLGGDTLADEAIQQLRDTIEADAFVSGSGSNTIGLNDAAYDKLLSDAARETDGTKRAAILQQAEKRLIDQNGLIPVYYFVSKHLVKPYVKGYEANVMNHWPSKYIRIEK